MFLCHSSCKLVQHLFSMILDRRPWSLGHSRKQRGINTGYRVQENPMPGLGASWDELLPGTGSPTIPSPLSSGLLPHHVIPLVTGLHLCRVLCWTEGKLSEGSDDIHFPPLHLSDVVVSAGEQMHKLPHTNEFAPRERSAGLRRPWGLH